MESQIDRQDETKVQKTSWTLDTAHSRLQFLVRHMLISEVSGHFNSYSMSVSTAGDNFDTTEVEVSIDVQSIDTGVPGRDDHLRSADFFDAEKYPKMTFKSIKLKELDDNRYKLTGSMTIKDITKTIELDLTYGGQATDKQGIQRAGFKAMGVINRFDHDIKWNKLIETGNAIVGRHILFTCNIELIKQK
ncbi:MAG: YceI family protein [Ignavibacteria bacterium]